MLRYKSRGMIFNLLCFLTSVKLEWSLWWPQGSLRAIVHELSSLCSLKDFPLPFSSVCFILK